jgi:FKBP-type peptidyl-prolyl cis-trans isomerase 2
MLVTGQSKGRPVQARVVEVGEADVTLDFNHPLAGKTLGFDTEVIEVVPPSGRSDGHP